MAEQKNYMYKSWWKITGVLLLVYTVVAGMLLDVPLYKKQSGIFIFMFACGWQ